MQICHCSLGQDMASALRKTFVKCSKNSEAQAVLLGRDSSAKVFIKGNTLAESCRMD